jgi:hypothetical protein
MKMSSVCRFEIGIAQFARHCLGLLLVLLLGLGGQSPASATLLYTADSSGAVLVQSRWTLRDTERHSWQVIAFKRVEPDGREAGLVLRLVGFPGVVEIVHPQPIGFVDLKGQSQFAVDASDQISAHPPAHVGQYDLQSVLLQLPFERLQLELPLQSGTTGIRVSPAMLEEWQTVASVLYRDLQNSCDKFPVEARQNPAFPAWVGCSAQ